MSIDINYDSLDDSLSDNLLKFLNQKLETINKPSILGKLQFTSMSWGDKPPQIEIEEIGDLSSEFEEEEEKEEKEEEEVEEDKEKNERIEPLPNLQLKLNLHHESDITLNLMTTLDINYPSPSFMSLPIKLTIKGIIIDSKVIIGIDNHRRQVHLSLLNESDESSDLNDLNENDINNHILKSLVVESQIGQIDKHTLINVRKVEIFILNYFRNLLNDEIVYPNYQTFIY